MKSSRQPTHLKKDFLLLLFFALFRFFLRFLRMLCLFLPCVVFCVCFVPDAFFCVFLSICFLVCVLFRMFCSVRFVLRTGCFVPVRPSAPTITTYSPNGTVPANTAVSCTCTTSSVGQPQGRLKWVKVTDGSQITAGGYGSTTLQMTPQTLTLSDHDVKFRCDVDWVEDVTGQLFRASVGCE